MFVNQLKDINEKTYINTKMELSIDMVKMFQCIGCYEISNTYIEYGVLLIVFGIQMQEIIVHIFYLDLDHLDHFCTRILCTVKMCAFNTTL